MTLSSYQWLGIASILLLVTALGLSVFIMMGKRSPKATYLVAGTVLVLMLAVSIICAVIYGKYGRGL
jgi:ABC-type proline/glycine betaine transport system permease subunit